jgi:hypothetical protein
MMGFCNRLSNVLRTLFLLGQLALINQLIEPLDSLLDERILHNVFIIHLMEIR